MKIIKANYEIMTAISPGGIEELKFIERVGRTCYKSEDKITEDGESAKRFVRMLIEKGHEAMLEHSILSVRFIVDRGISHEIVRHRIASFAQESTRYVTYSKRNPKINSEENVVEAYKIGLSMKKISLKSNGKYTEWDVYKILKKNGIKSRGLGSRGLINENYFENIDAPEKAYLIGFIMADGSIRRDIKELTISQKEDEQWWILNMIRTFIQPESKTLNISNKKICQDLLNKGIVPNKTYESTEKSATDLWNSIADNYKFDFIRGLMDGNGCIRWFYQKNTSKTLSCRIMLYTNKYLLLKIQNFIYEKFGYIGKVKQDSKSECMYRYGIYDFQTGKKVCEEMYKNFKFPYGHSKTSRYFDAFNIPVPISLSDISKNDFNIICPFDKFKTEGSGQSKKMLWIWGMQMMESEISYKNMIEEGIQPQIARSVLPNSLKTEIVMTANYREWRNFFRLRTAKAAHPQIREVAVPLLNELRERIPVVFEDIKAEE